MANRIKMTVSIKKLTFTMIKQLIDQLDRSESNLIDWLVSEEWKRQDLPPMNGKGDNCIDPQEDISTNL